MRQGHLGIGLLAATLAACGGNDSTGIGTGELIVHGPAVTIGAGGDSTLCLFVHAGNGTVISIKSWQATLASGIASAALFQMPNDAQPVGTVTSSSCDPTGSGSTVGALLFESRVANSSVEFPDDDGHGKPVAGILEAAQPLMVRIHYVNPGASAITPQLTFTGTSYPAGTAVTRADPFITFNHDVDLGIGSSGTFNDSCATPAGANFFRLTVFTHSQSTAFSIADGDNPLYSASDNLHPGAAVRLAAPFFAFTSGRMTTTCSYTNTTGHELQTGSSFADNENCIGATWYFPSTAAKFCTENVVVDLNRAVLPTRRD